jgi:recombination endonuclease VII
VLTRQCRQCEQVKNINEFPVFKSEAGRRDGYLRRGYVCFLCRRLKIQKQRFALSDEQIQEVYSKGLECFVCAARPPELRDLHIDHCHYSFVIRGLLCRRCNHLVGLLEKTPAAIMGKLQKYITVSFLLAHLNI